MYFLSYYDEYSHTLLASPKHSLTIFTFFYINTCHCRLCKLVCVCIPFYIFFLHNLINTFLSLWWNLFFFLYYQSAVSTCDECLFIYQIVFSYYFVVLINIYYHVILFFLSFFGLCQLVFLNSIAHFFSFFWILLYVCFRFVYGVLFFCASTT